MTNHGTAHVLPVTEQQQKVSWKRGSSFLCHVILRVWLHRLWPRDFLLKRLSSCKTPEVCTERRSLIASCVCMQRARWRVPCPCSCAFISSLKHRMEWSMSFHPPLCLPASRCFTCLILVGKAAISGAGMLAVKRVRASSVLRYGDHPWRKQWVCILEFCIGLQSSHGIQRARSKFPV